MIQCSQKFPKILTAQWSPKFLLTKHNGVIEIENDPRICTLQHGELPFCKADRFKKDDDIVSRRLSYYAPAIGEIRTRGEDRKIDIDLLVKRNTIAQTQTRARRISVLNDAKNLHRITV
ncbi:MAG: hypothetical protein QOI04_1551 [Verrucomicrobiota bacterium]